MFQSLLTLSKQTGRNTSSFKNFPCSGASKTSRPPLEVNWRPPREAWPPPFKRTTATEGPLALRVTWTQRNLVAAEMRSQRRISCRDLGRGDCEGWLWKKRTSSAETGSAGPLAQKWAKRWVVIKGRAIYCYRTNADDDNSRADCYISLPGYTVRPSCCRFSSKCSDLLKDSHAILARCRRSRRNPIGNLVDGVRASNKSCWSEAAVTGILPTPHAPGGQICRPWGSLSTDRCEKRLRRWLRRLIFN